MRAARQVEQVRSSGVRARAARPGERDGRAGWIRAKTADQDERGNAERRALFVGLWAPTLWQIGDTLRMTEQPSRDHC
jgi:hypothetical protein